MEVLNYDKVGERLYHQVLENGLNVFVSPKPGYQKGYAFFATNYGGMDTRFCLGDEWKQTPEGVATPCRSWPPTGPVPTPLPPPLSPGTTLSLPRGLRRT